MSDGEASVRVVHLDDVAEIGDPADQGALWRPIRRTLGLTGVGANAYTARRAGEELIESHDELSPGAGGHEELYVVISGRATFVVDGREIDAPAGTLLAIDVGVRRQAMAAEGETTVLVLGGKPGAAAPPSPFEYWYAAEPAYRSGDYEAAIETARPGLAHHPTNPGLNYNLACYAALAGRGDEAVGYLRVALQSGDERVPKWAADDADLDSIRGRDDFPAAGAGPAAQLPRDRAGELPNGRGGPSSGLDPTARRR